MIIPTNFGVWHIFLPLNVFTAVENVLRFYFYFTAVDVVSCGGRKTIPGPEVIKLFFIPNSAEHEILNAHK